MGARFRLKASFNISGYSAQAQTVLKAMQTYGLVLADNGSPWYFQGTADNAWPDALIESSRRFRPARSRPSTPAASRAPEQRRRPLVLSAD